MSDDDKALVEQLRKDTNKTDIWGRKKNWTEQRSERRKAATRIEAQAAEIERLRGLLREVLSDDEALMDITWRERGYAALGETK